MMSLLEAGVEHRGNMWIDDDPKRITTSIYFTSLLGLSFYSTIPKTVENTVEKTRILLVCHRAIH